MPHTDIDSTDDDLKRLADSIARRNLVAGSLVAPVWPPTGGGSAMGSEQERKLSHPGAQGLRHRQEAARPRHPQLRRGPHRFRRWPAEWAKDPLGNTRRIAETFREACTIAEDHGERLAAEGEICWGGMHSWKHMVELLELVDRPKTLGFQADMAHTMLYTMGYNSPEDRLLPEDFDWSDQDS